MEKTRTTNDNQTNINERRKRHQCGKEKNDQMVGRNKRKVLHRLQLPKSNRLQTRVQAGHNSKQKRIPDMVSEFLWASEDVLSLLHVGLTGDDKDGVGLQCNGG